MANELKTVSVKSLTIYGHVLNSAGQRWNGTAFETYVAGNYANYDIPMTEQGTSGVYIGNFPSAITTAATYQLIFYRQLAGSPAQGDPVSGTGSLDWNGTQVVSAATGSMTGSAWRDYVLRLGFKRTDKDTELYEATTDAIQEMRRRFMFDEAEADTTTTDSISILGDFKLNLETDFGLLAGLILQDDENAHELIKLSKTEFDERYPDINVTNDRGYPKHFTIYSGQIYLGPIPDQTSYTYRKHYSRSAATISSSTTGVPFTNLYRDVLADNVLARLYKGLGEFGLSSAHRNDFELGFLLITRKEMINSGAHMFNMKKTDC